MIDKKNLLVRLGDAVAVEDRSSMANLLKEAAEAIRFYSVCWFDVNERKPSPGFPMRAIDADLFIRWTERDEHGEPVECCGTVEDYLSGARTEDGQRIIVEEMDDG